MSGGFPSFELFTFACSQIQIALQKQAQATRSTPNPSYRRAPSRRRLVIKFGSAPISSSPRTPWWRNSAALAAGKRCSRPFWAVFCSNLNKNRHRRNGCGHTAAALPPRPRAAHTAPGHPGPAAHRVWAAAASISPGCAGGPGHVPGRLLRGAVLGRFAAKTAAASALPEV